MGRINNDAAFFMSYVRGEDRGQAALLPAAIEDYSSLAALIALAKWSSAGQLKRRMFCRSFRSLVPHWSRELQALGHTVRLMPPAYVKPTEAGRVYDGIV